jgi:hypothetical protein
MNESYVKKVFYYYFKLTCAGELGNRFFDRNRHEGGNSVINIVGYAICYADTEACKAATPLTFYRQQ